MRWKYGMCSGLLLIFPSVLAFLLPESHSSLYGEGQRRGTVAVLTQVRASQYPTNLFSTPARAIY